MRYIEKNMASAAVRRVQAELSRSKKYSDCKPLKHLMHVMYNACCAYCEHSPEGTSFSHCDHFYPKKLARFTKAIENLHYACQRCNMLKLDNDSRDIFSPNLYLDSTGQWRCTDPLKIETELFYKGHLLFARNNKKDSINRGHNTIEMFDLNANRGIGRRSRKTLVEDRIRLFKLVSKQIEFIVLLLEDNNSKFNPWIEDLFNQILEHTRPRHPFSTMIIHNFGNDIIKLMKIYLHRKRLNTI